MNAGIARRGGHRDVALTYRRRPERPRRTRSCRLEEPRVASVGAAPPSATVCERHRDDGDGDYLDPALHALIIGPLVYSFAFILASICSQPCRLAHVPNLERTGRPRKSARLELARFVDCCRCSRPTPELSLHPGARVFLGVAPFAGVMGFLTPMLVDRWSRGDAARAGGAYAVNVLGCIVGPLLVRLRAVAMVW